MRINETCGACGGGLSASSDSEPALSRIVNDWRTAHPCSARDRAQREVTAGAQAEQSYAAPHRTDTTLGFTIHPDPTVDEAREILGYPPRLPEPREPVDTPANT